jgi:5-methyltetrahydrofolate--homocysteine methyltransferase
MLQQRGLAAGGLPELLNITSPETVVQIHREYAQAGADIITANTFGAYELKLDGNSVEDAVHAGIRCARDSGARFAALDVGPTGKLVGPLGDLSFERAYEVFRRQMTAGEQAGADLIIIETMSDPYEVKAAVLAAKENTNLPVFCTMTFSESGRTFLGCDALTATIILQGLGVDALGVNCSLGPDKIAPIVKTMLEYSHVPVILQANAGLPVLRNGEAHYEMQPEEYANYAVEMARCGVRVLGGCCGTTPEHIRRIKQQLEGIKPIVISPPHIDACSSGSRTVIFEGGGQLTKMGEYPGDIDDLVDEAIELAEDGAQIIGLPEFDEPAMMAQAICEIQQVVTAPLQFGSLNPAAIEAGLRVYNGRPVISPVGDNAGNKEAVFSLAKKYGALAFINN